jgi:hypothetical protein
MWKTRKEGNYLTRKKYQNNSLSFGSSLDKKKKKRVRNEGTPEIPKGNGFLFEILLVGLMVVLTFLTIIFTRKLY